MTTATEFKNQTKHEAILQYATRVFAKDGFAATDVQQIADQADVGKGTVYRYFGNKSDLFLACADAGMKKLDSCIYNAIEGVDSAVETTRKVASAYAKYFEKNPEMVEILIQERAAFRGFIPDTHMVYRRKNQGVLGNVLRSGVESGEIRKLDVRAASDALANMLYGTVVCSLEGSNRKLGQMVEQAVEIFLNGILSQPKD